MPARAKATKSSPYQPFIEALNKKQQQLLDSYERDKAAGNALPDDGIQDLAEIAAASPPAAILVGGTSDYLSEQAFREIRDAIVAARQGIAVESFEAGTELVAILDSYRTGSLFGSGRLLIVPEVNAFVSAKELSSLLDKAAADWKSAKTDKKRSSSAAKLLHVLGLAGCDLDMTDRQIAGALGVPADGPIGDMLAFCR